MLGDFRRRHSLTNQPAKYLSGFLFGLFVYGLLAAIGLTVIVALGVDVPPWQAILFFIFCGGCLMGVAE